MGPRDHLIDAARILAVLAVVVYHCLFFEVALDDGRLAATRWVPGEGLLVLGWFVMILPVFFIAAGYGHAASAESRPAPSGRASRQAAVERLARRAARLAGPVLLFVTVLAMVATVVAWWPGAPPSLPYPGSAGLGRLDLATTLSRDYADFLWFLVAHLVVTALADPMIRLHDRWGLVVPVVLGVGAAVVDRMPGIAGVNWILVWLACHQLGIGLRRGWFRRWAWVTLATAAAGVVVLVAVAGYPLSPIANYYPPSVAIVVLAVAQASVLALLGRAGVMRDVGAVTRRRLAVAGANLVTVYLWQAACIILAILLLVGLGRVVPGPARLLVHPLAIVVVSFAVITAVVPWVARLERRLVPVRAPREVGRVGSESVAPREVGRVGPVSQAPREVGPAGPVSHAPPTAEPAGPVSQAPPTPRGLGAAVPFALLLAGTTLVWQNGAVLHPERPWSTAGVVLVWGAALSLVATRQRATGGETIHQ